MKRFLYVTTVLLLFMNSIVNGDDKEAIAKAKEARESHDYKVAIDALKPLVDKKNPEAMLLLSRIYASSQDPEVRNPAVASFFEDVPTFVKDNGLLDKAVCAEHMGAFGYRSDRCSYPRGKTEKSASAYLPTISYETR